MRQHKTKIRRFLREGGLLAFLLCVAWCPWASALDPSRLISQYGHTAWRIQDGYIPGVAEAIAQTTDGYLWIGTYAGLVRFDGAHYVPFDPGNGQQLADYRIYALLGARDGSLWIGTGGGLSRWKGGVLTNYESPHARVSSIVEDAEGTVWIVRAQDVDTSGPLCRVTGANPRCYGRADGIPMATGVRLALDDQGNLWIGGFEGLCRWKPGSSTTYFQQYLKKHGLLLGAWSVAAQKNGEIWVGLEGAGGDLELQHFVHGEWKREHLPGVDDTDQGIASLFVDRQGALWIGTGKRGIFRIYKGKTDHFSSAEGLSGDAVATFFQDREGLLWVGGSKGVDSFRDLAVVSFSEQEGLSGDSVSTVLAGRDGTVWVGNSGALDALRGDKVSSIRTKYGLPGRDVTTMFEDHAGRLWLGIDGGLFIFDKDQFQPILKPDGQPIGTIFAITEDTRHRMWVRASYGRLLEIENDKIKNEQKMPLPQPFAMAADATDGVWFGYDNGDLVRYRDDKFDTFAADAHASHAKIRKILPHPDGSLWGITDEGLLWWDGKKRTQLTSKNGLPCDELYTGVEDDQGTLWIYARCGLLSVSAAGLKNWQREPTSRVQSTLFDVYDGVQSGPTPLQPQSARSADGQLWFGNDSILQSFDPRRLRRNSVPPVVLVERMVSDGIIYATKNDIHLPALSRNLEIDYTALSFVVPQKVHFRYKLEGHDTAWQEPQARRQAFYSDLPPGDYHFRVAACNNDGVWSDAGSVLDFSVEPAFFQQAWFLALCLGAFGGLLWMAYLLRLKQVAAGIRARMEERLGERERIARELHDTLLQSIQGLILRFHAVTKQIPAEAPARLSMENALDRADRVLAEGRDRVLNLRASAEFPSGLAEAFRVFGEESTREGGSSVTVVVEGAARRLHPMVREEVFSIGREAMTNSLLHANGGRVEIEITYDSKHLALRVRDDGCGIDTSVLEAGGRQGHWGLQGMRERARQIGGRLDIWSRVGSGTEVELRVPASRAYQRKVPGPRWIWLRRVLSRNG